MLEWGYGVLRKKRLVKYAFIKANQRLFSITRIFAVLEVQPSSYYNWITRNISDQQIHRNHWLLLVRRLEIKSLAKA